MTQQWELAKKPNVRWRGANVVKNSGIALVCHRVWTGASSISYGRVTSTECLFIMCNPS